MEDCFVSSRRGNWERSSCSSRAFRTNYFTYLMCGHRLDGNRHRLITRGWIWPFAPAPLTPLEGIWVETGNDRTGGCELASVWSEVLCSSRTELEALSSLTLTPSLGRSFLLRSNSIMPKLARARAPKPRRVGVPDLRRTLASAKTT